MKSIIIPAYNESKRIKKVLLKLAGKGYMVVVVNDGSDDKTFEVLSKLKIKNLKLIILNHKVNLGKGAALKTGAEYSFAKGAEAVIFMDSDGQHDPSDLHLFENDLNNGNEFVVGTRNLSYGVPLVRYMGNKFASLFVALLFHTYVSDLLCGFRAMTKSTYRKIKWDSSGYGVETEMIVNAAVKNIPIKEISIRAIYHDSVKGVTILDAVNILFDVLFWRLKK
jgi:glycosyltransferase involved in cell wall biosynthesis